MTESIKTMRAVSYEAYGNPADVVQVDRPLPIPTISDTQVLIKVHAAGVNPVDWKIIMGYTQAVFDAKPSPSNPVKVGFDVAGTVEAVGSKVTKFQVGDEVFAMATFPTVSTFAEFFATEESLVALKPTTVSFEEAGSLPVVALTSYQALFEHGKLQHDDKVLILGGSGGTGSLAIQLAHSVGAHITTTCSGRNADYVRSLGADRVVDYTKEKFSEVLEPNSFDVVYACAEGDLSDVAKVIKKGNGRFVSIVEGYQPAPGTNVDFSMKPFFGRSDGAQLEQIAKLVDDKKIKVLVDAVYALEQIKDAFDDSMHHRTRGKIVVKVR